MLGVRYALVGVRGYIEEALYFTSLDNVLLDDFLCIRGLNPCVESIVRNDLDDRTSFAESEAAGNDYLGEIGQVVSHEFLVEFGNDLVTGGCGATCTTANQNMHFNCHVRFLWWLD